MWLLRAEGRGGVGLGKWHSTVFGGDAAPPAPVEATSRRHATAAHLQRLGRAGCPATQCHYPALV